MEGILKMRKILFLLFLLIIPFNVSAYDKVLNWIDDYSNSYTSCSISGNFYDNGVCSFSTPLYKNTNGAIIGDYVFLNYTFNNISLSYIEIFDFNNIGNPLIMELYINNESINYYYNNDSWYNTPPLVFPTNNYNSPLLFNFDNNWIYIKWLNNITNISTLGFKFIATTDLQ